MRSKVPAVRQLEAVECGAASLTMLLGYHGCHVPLSEMREACDVTRNGTNALALLKAARRYGLKASARRMSIEALPSRGYPVIIHWNLNHFLVLEGKTDDGYLLVDPAFGRRTVTEDTFGRCYTGIAIYGEPGKDFEQRAPSRHTLDQLSEHLKGAHVSLSLLIGAGLVMTLLASLLPLAIQLVVDHVLLGNDWLLAISAGLLTAGLAHLLIGLCRQMLTIRLRAYMGSVYVGGMVDRLMRLPMLFFLQRGTSDLVTRVASANLLRDLLTGRAVQIGVDAMLVALYFGLMFTMSWQLTLGVAGLSCLYVGTFLWNRPYITAATNEAAVAGIKQSGKLLLMLLGIRGLKSSGQTQSAQRSWLREVVTAANANAIEQKVRFRVAAWMQLISLLGPVLMTYLGAQMVVDGSWSLGTLLAFLFLQGSFQRPIQSALDALLDFEQLPLHLERLDDVQRTELEPSGTEAVPRLQGEIELRDVVFRYGPSLPPVLDGISLTIPAGHKVAFVGSSGSGKSTLMKLMLGLLTPTSGQILYDGMPMEDLSRDALRRQFGVIPQRPCFFTGTVRENLSINAPGASLDDVVNAARMANIHEHIESLPLAYHTKMDNRGGAFSGGQLQRVALARALVANPTVLFLDEATSALDSESEAVVEMQLGLQQCTRVVVAHRLTTVRDADQIVVLDHGKISEMGRHHELRFGGGIYQHLCGPAEEEVLTDDTQVDAQQQLRDAMSFFEPFRTLAPALRASLIETLVLRRYAPGDTVVEANSSDNGLHCMIRGRCEVMIVQAGLEQFKVAEIGPGEVIGELSLMDAQPSSAAVVAVEPLFVMHLSADAYRKLSQSHPRAFTQLRLQLGAFMAARLLATVEQHDRMVSMQADGVVDGVA